MTSIIDHIERDLENVRSVDQPIPLQNSEEWHEARLKKFTASKAGDMMKRGKGDNPFGVPCINYIHEKLAEILTNQPHIVESRATNWGHDMEDQAVEAYEEEKGVKTDRVGFVEWNEYAGGSPDRLIEKDGLLEIKCPYNSANHVSVMLSQELPENHFWQVQFNLMVTKRDWCDYVSYDPRVSEESLKLVIIRVSRDTKAIQAIQERLIEVKAKLDELKAKFS